MIDLLVSDQDLSEYRLPEFKVKTLGSVFERAYEVKIEDEEWKGKKQLGHEEQKLAFIVFGQREHWHLFDHENYAFRSPDDKERMRRVEILREKAGGKAQKVEAYSGETYHRGTTLFGICCRAEDLEHVLRIMRESRSEISIKKEYFDKEQIQRDMIEMLEEDIAYILNKIPDEGETRVYLVRRLKEQIEYEEKAKMTPDNWKEVEKVFADGLDHAKRIEDEERVEKELQKFDEAERKFPVEARQPKGLSIKRGRR